MPKRPRSHEIEGLSRRQLHDLFGRLGWVVWDLHPDYGEDLLVRIFAKGIATHYSFFVQAKATDHIDKYMDKERKCLSFPIDVDHLEHWEQFWEPVILTLWDSVSNITYWAIIQDYLEFNNWNKSRKRVSVNIPITNILDDNGLKTIHERTISRFHRFELTCEGVNALINYLDEQLDVEVLYEPGGNDLLIIRNSEISKFVATNVGAKLQDLVEKFYLVVHNVQGSIFLSTPIGVDIIFLGDVAEKSIKAAERANTTLQQFFDQYFRSHMEKYILLESSPDHS